MTDNEKNALARAWNAQYDWAKKGDEDSLCFLDLVSRIENLENASKSQNVNSQKSIEDSLMTRMKRAVAPCVRPYRLNCYREEASNAIREIIDWIKPMSTSTTAAEIIEALQEELKNV